MLLLRLSGAYPYSRFCIEHAGPQSVLSSGMERNLHTSHRIQVMVPSGVEIRDLVEIDLTPLKDLLLLTQPEGVQPLHLCYGTWDSCDHPMCCYSGHCCRSQRTTLDASPPCYLVSLSSSFPSSCNPFSSSFPLISFFLL